MITVEITNPEAIVNQHEGWLTGLAGTVATHVGMIDLADKVQKAIAQKLIDELGADNVRVSLSDPSEKAGAEE